MTAIDTNVLVRFLAEDDADQAGRATHLFETGPVYLSLSVLLESFWVLRKTLGLPSQLVLDMVVAVTRLPGVTVEASARFHRSVELTRHNMSFADALHLTATDDSMRFATFDQGMIRAAQRADVARVFEP